MLIVIIPAHNESAVIGETLRALQLGATKASEVIVVCNGCTDDTADRARAVAAENGQVIEIPVGSKPGALNEGDRLASGFPRIYMDADVRINGSDIEKLVDYMARTGVPAASPRAEMDFSGTSWFVRGYYRVWFSLPYVSVGMVGCGVYALSEEGRARFGEFPDIISDDGFVRGHFSDAERPVVIDCVVKVRAPRTLSGLIKIKTRSRLGGRQLRMLYPELVKRELSNPRWRTLLRIFLRPQLWISLPSYIFVVLVSVIRSRRQFANGQFNLWERDDSSRSSTIATSTT